MKINERQVYNLPGFGLMQIKLFPHAFHVYKFLEGYNHISRLQQIDQLGPIREVLRIKCQAESIPLPNCLPPGSPIPPSEASCDYSPILVGGISSIMREMGTLSTVYRKPQTFLYSIMLLYKKVNCVKKGK